MTEESQPSIAERYHEETKYSPQLLAKSTHKLDWSRQPDLWKEYPGAELVALAPHLGLKGPSLADALGTLPLPELPKAPIGRAHLARLLFFTNGVTRVVPPPSPGAMPFLMRAAPSAGGLYPTETYLVLDDGRVEGVGGGAWGFDNRDLSLVRVAKDAWGKVAAATAIEPLFKKARAALVLTGIFWRSSWRYQERAYRRILLDTGHVLGNLVMSAARLGLVALPIGGFDDAAVEEALGIDPLEEGALVVVPLFDPSEVEVRPPRGSLALRGPVVPADAVKGGESVLKTLHLATRLRPPLAKAAGRDAPGDTYQSRSAGKVLSLPHSELDMARHVERTILVRRSTRSLTGEAFSLEEVSKLLHFAYAANATGEADGRFAPATIDASLLETYVAWNQSEGADPGIYYYRARSHDLVLVKPGAFSRECHEICLGQELGRDAACVLFHTADLPRAVARYGDRAYRYIHLDAGHLGQRLNLAAIRAGLGASGIGGFFDDQANELLGLPPRSVIVYPTCLGRAEGVS